MNTLRCLLCLLLLACLGAAFAGPPTLKLTIPKSSHAPTLDGKLSPGEWDDAAAVSGIINQFDGVAHPRQAAFWIKYDDKNVYIAQQSVVQPQERDVKASQLWMDRDSSFVVAIDPARIGRGDEPSHFLLRYNIKAQTLTQEIFWKLKGVRLTYPHPSWPVDTKSEQTLDDAGNWVVEMAIPLASLKTSDLKDGEEWGLFFARDYACGDQNAIVESTDWRFGEGLRWWGRAFYNNYRLEKEYARAKVQPGAPAVQVLDWGDIFRGQLAPSISVTNTGASPCEVFVRREVQIAYGVGGMDKPEEYRLQLAPGERKTQKFTTLSLPADERHVATLSATSADGTVLYHQELPIQPGYGKDRNDPVPDVYFSGYHFGGKQDIYGNRSDNILLSTVYDPILNEICGRVRPDSLADPKAAARAELTVRRQGEATPIATVPMLPRRPTDQDWEANTKLPALNPGVYEATACVYAADGRLLGRSRQTFIRYDHAKDMPWIGNSIGKSTKVLPPWTPITSKKNPAKQSVDLTCWGRTYKINRSGLFGGLTTLGHEVLAGPVRIELTSGGKPVALTPAKALSALITSPDEASYRGEAIGQGWKVTTRGQMDYDGYMLYRIKLAPQGKQRADRIRLVIPLKPEEATHLHAAGGEWFRKTVSSIALGPGNGVLWNSKQNCSRDIKPINETFGSFLTTGSFRPYVWIGNATRGLAFMADSDEGWVPDDTRKEAAIEVVRKKGEVQLVLNLVARPFTFNGPREVCFSLQATPVKPLLDDFRERRRQLAMVSAFPGAFEDTGWSWSGQMLNMDDGKGGKTWLFGLPGSAPYPVNWDISRQYREHSTKHEFHSGNWIDTPYQSQLMVMTFPELDDPRMPAGKQAADVYGYIFPHISGGHREHGNGNMAQEDVDYRLWCYQSWIKYVGLEGMYFDQTEPVLTGNPKAGFGYVLDLPDRPGLNGQIQPGYGLSRMREFYKRLRTLFVENGHDRPYVWLHTTDANLVSAFSFTDFFLEGENQPLVSKKMPASLKLPPERMQAMSNGGGKWGLPMLQLEMLDLSVPRDDSDWREITGWFMLHDTEGTEHGMYNWAGIDLTRKAEFLPYWDPAVSSALHADQPEVYASAWRQDNALRVLVFNRNPEERKNVRLAIDPKSLGIRPAKGGWLAVKDLQANSPMHHQSDGRTLIVPMDIGPRDYRLLRIEGNGTPGTGSK